MGDEKKVYVRELKEYFNLKQVSGDDDSLNRWVVAPDINRPGLELTGFDSSNELKRVIVIGNKESSYLSNLDYETKYHRFEMITDSYTPCIVITGGNKADDALLEVAGYRNFPIFETETQTFRMSVDIISFLDEHLAPTDYVHGVMMNIFGVGVLITGESGIGKSELALELINRGHVLIGDDRIEIKKLHNEIYASAHPLLKDYLEIRGVGIIDVPLMFGAGTIVDKAVLSLVIHLERYDQNADYNRIGDHLGRETKNMMGVDIPTVAIPVKEGRAIGVIVEAAVINHRLNKQGINSSENFCKGISQAISDRRNGQTE